MLRSWVANSSRSLRLSGLVGCRPAFAAAATARSFSRKSIAAPEREARYSKYMSHPPSFERIGILSFSQSKLRQSVPYPTYVKFKQSLGDPEVQLNKQDKNEIADALLKWGLANGCTNFAHWFTAALFLIRFIGRISLNMIFLYLQVYSYAQP